MKIANLQHDDVSWCLPRKDSARTQVLIVGAGPAGLIAAIRLREAGVQVRVIDELAADGSRSYPAVIHQQTLRILSSMGITAPLEWRGHDVSRLAVYIDGRCRAVLELPSTEEIGPAAMTLPQGVLREALLHRLSALGTRVEWQTRIEALEQDATRVRVRLVRRERVHDKRADHEPASLELAAESLDAQFVVGADGPQSTVREKLGIDWIPSGRRQFYVSYEVPDPRAGNEAHLVIYEGLSNSIYPFQSGVSRFTFEVPAETSDAPEIGQLRQLLEARMPWYAAEAERFEWCSKSEVNPGVAARFGEGRVWLTGEAAHSNGPLGGQSLNVGMCEANELALRMVEQLGRPGVAALGVLHTEPRSFPWQREFGLCNGVAIAERPRDWVRRNIATVLPSLPASGDALDDLLLQLNEASA